MTALYVHVGIPKSGTTSIQDNLRGDQRINFIDTFYFHKADYWSHKDFTLSEDQVNLVSNETFSVRGERSGKVPLHCILQRIVNQCEDTRIILTIRNQLTALASMFRFRILMGGNFASFRDWLVRDEGMDFFAANQYGTLVRSMTQFVPIDKIKVLCFEDLATDPVGFYNNLYGFFNLPLEPDRIDCRRHSNRTSTNEHVYARNIANRFIGTNNRVTRRLNGLTVRVLKARVESWIPEDFFALKSVDCYDGVLSEIRFGNQLLLEYFPELKPQLEKHAYVL